MPSRAAEMAWLRSACLSGEARRIRTAAKVTCEDIATDIPAAAPTVQRWETGKRVPRGTQAVRYAAVLRELQQLAQAAS